MVVFTIVMIPLAESYWKDKSAIVTNMRVPMNEPAQVRYFYKMFEQLATSISNSDLRCIISREGEMILDNMRGVK